MILQIIIVFAIGFVFGFSQSLLVGIKAGSWSGGTGILWGIIIGIPSSITSVWIGWAGVWVTLIFSLLVFVASMISVSRDLNKSRR